MKTKLSRVLCIVFALAVVVTALPMSAFAARPLPKIKKVEITGVVEPVAGQKAVLEAKVPAGANYKVDSVVFRYYNGRNYVNAPADHEFVSGREYTCIVYVTCGDIYAFDDVDTVLANSTLNGVTTTDAMYGADADKKLGIGRTFTAQAPATTINSVTITDVVEPITGQKPVLEAKAPAGANYKVESVSFCYDDGSGLVTVSANHEFVSGRKYICYVKISCDDGYVFTDAENLRKNSTINGEAANAVRWGTGADKKLEIGRTFTAKDPSQKIDTVTITGVVEPIAGQKPVLEAKAPAGAHYKIEAVEYLYYSIRRFIPVPEDHVFESGREYQVRIHVVSDDGYVFAAPGTIVANSTVNGVAAIGTAQGSDITKRLGICCNFTAKDPAQKIDTVAITLSTPLTAGSVWKYDDIAVTTPNCKKSNARIEDADGKTLADNAPFEAGKKYTLKVFVEPESGYEFAAYTEMKATVNGDASATVNSVSNQPEKRCVNYEFTATEAGKLDLLLVESSKSADAAGYVDGEAVNYTLTIENKTDEDLTDVVVSNAAGNLKTFEKLAKGEKQTVTFKHTVTETDVKAGSVSMIAGISYKDGKSNAVTASSNAVNVACKTGTTPPPATTTDVTRISGDDRVATSVEISKKTFTSAKNVVIAGGSGYADALAGAPLAYAVDGPILLVMGKSLSNEVRAELDRLGATDIYILGGTSAVSKDVEDQLAKYGAVKRVAGSTRFETSVKIAELVTQLSGAPSELFIAYSANYPDALAISPVAAKQGSPILYADKSGKLNADVEKFIKASGCTNATILGGTANIPAATEKALNGAGIASIKRIGGADRYETMLKINNTYASLLNGTGVCVATGTNFPDALAGGVFAAKNSMPIVLVPAPAKVTAEIVSYVKANSDGKLYVFGGPSAVSNDTVNLLK